MKKFIKEIYSYVIIIVAVVLFRTFIATPVRVDGSSMDDTLKDGDILILNKLDHSFERFDIVVINKKINGKTTKLVKRIIGLPGENIRYDKNYLYINNKKINDVSLSRTANFNLKELYDIEIIPNNYYFVMGDNRNKSMDSRDYRVGLINKNDIVGTTKLRLYRFNKIGFVK